MNQLTFDAFDVWLTQYSKASQENDVQASSDLFSDDAQYYESPFGKPIVGRKAIQKYWKLGAAAYIDKVSSHEILAVKANVGIAHWVSNFTRAESKKRLVLDCIFIVEFDRDGKCTIFCEWWHLQEVDPLNRPKPWN